MMVALDGGDDGGFLFSYIRVVVSLVQGLDNVDLPRTPPHPLSPSLPPVTPITRPTRQRTVPARV